MYRQMDKISNAHSLLISTKDEEFLNYDWKAVLNQLTTFYRDDFENHEIQVKQLSERNIQLNKTLIELQKPTKDVTYVDQMVSCSIDSETLQCLENDNQKLREDLNKSAWLVDELRLKCAFLNRQRMELEDEITHLKEAYEKESRKVKSKEEGKVKSVERRLYEAYKELREKDSRIEQVERKLKKELKEKNSIHDMYEVRLEEIESRQKDLEEEIIKLQETMKQQWKLIDFLIKKE